MKRLALLAIMALALAACENRVEKKEEHKSTTEVTQPAGDEGNKTVETTVEKTSTDNAAPAN